MDNQVLESEATGANVQTDSRSRTLVLRALAALAVLAVAIAIILAFQHNDPYVKAVLALDGNANQGNIIFQMNCASCHGLHGDGVVGPSLHHVSSRKSRIGLIRQVTSGETPPMPQFQPNPQEMADLLEFLQGL